MKSWDGVSKEHVFMFLHRAFKKEGTGISDFTASFNSHGHIDTHL